VIHFFDPARPEGEQLAASGPWEHVAAIVGDLLEPMGIYPERYRVRSFPSEEQIVAIRVP
jgi:hypothetical protein